ncbi:queuosine salvage family protein [Halorubrum distributum]|uniref:queuosine salvage family protein n=1 Tax=Halorubrum distributum TaxID=29283 RepID=UPI0029531BCC|nr:queuosine salvage family protein [Halorubrum distributum]MDV7351122.1 queuosine salvage family protein [Halorubrum distributum]
MAIGYRTLQNTPVRESVGDAVRLLRHVNINDDAIHSVANEWDSDDFELPAWRAPVFPDESEPNTSSEDVIDFLFIGNSINFAFRHFDTGDKFTASYNGTKWEGAFGMWACLKRAYDADREILSGNHLAQLTLNEVKNLFEPSDGNQIPMLEERYHILRTVGDRLVTEYDGHFHNLISEGPSQLYADGEGIVDRLIRTFPSFDDTSELDGQTIHFHKRAQLAPGMAFGRFINSDFFQIEDPSAFTVFVDYNLPNVLRSLGILEYDQHLRKLIDRGNQLNKGDREEVELRVAAIAATDKLMELLNTKPNRTTPVYGPHMDYKLFSVRDGVETPVHKTRTTAY